MHFIILPRPVCERVCVCVRGLDRDRLCHVREKAQACVRFI